MSQENIFDTSIRVFNCSPYDKDAVWPQGIEIAIFRVPIRKRDGYEIDLIRSFAKKLQAHMAPNGIAYVICYAPQEAKSRPFEVADAFIRAGLNHIDNIVIEKSWIPGKRSEVNLVNSHDYVFHFCNGNVWKIDRMPIRKYLKTPDDVSCVGNLWKVEVGSLDESYPVDLAELLVRMSDVLPGSLIFDAFGGSASPIKVAMKLGHSAWVFEKDAKKYAKYDKLIKEKSNK